MFSLKCDSQGGRQVCVKAKQVSLLEKMPARPHLGPGLSIWTKSVGVSTFTLSGLDRLALSKLYVCNHSSSTPTGVCTLPSRLFLHNPIQSYWNQRSQPEENQLDLLDGLCSCFQQRFPTLAPPAGLALDSVRERRWLG